MHSVAAPDWTIVHSRFVIAASVIGLCFATQVGSQTISTLEQAETPPELSNLAQVVPLQEIEMTSPMSGMLLSAPQRLGAAFRQGDTLFEFLCTEQDAIQRIALADVDAAQAELRAKETLRQIRGATEIEVMIAQAQYRKAEAQHELETYRSTLCHITAPFDGVVVFIGAQANETVQAGQPIATYISLKDLRVRIVGDSTIYPYLEIGTTLKLHIDETNRQYEATLDYINSRIDPVNQIIEFGGVITNPDEALIPGLTGTAHISADNVFE